LRNALAWRIEIAESAERQLAKLDKQIARRITKYLRERIAPLEDPRSLGESLKGQLREYWKYRVGDYRIIADIQDDVLRILVVQIGNRKEVYR
jgi:mRNA interferase RelE/StbE